MTERKAFSDLMMKKSPKKLPSSAFAAFSSPSFVAPTAYTRQAKYSNKSSSSAESFRKSSSMPTCSISTLRTTSTSNSSFGDDDSSHLSYASGFAGDCEYDNDVVREVCDEGVHKMTAIQKNDVWFNQRSIFEKKSDDNLFSRGKFSSHYKLGREMRKGVDGSSMIREATSRRTGKVCSVRIVDSKKATGATSHVLTEIRILRELGGHPHILTLQDVYYDDCIQYYYLLSEQLGGNELFDQIVKRDYYNERDAREAVRCIMEGLQYCHDRRIVHRDLKAENLLLRFKDNDSDVVLADFGMAKKINNLYSLTTKCGSTGYIAPEILSVQYDSSTGTYQGGYDVGVDVWSLGVITYILLGGYAPFDDSDPKHLCRAIKEGDYQFHPEFWGHVGQDAKDFITSLFSINPRDRPTIQEAMQSKWMKASDTVLVSHDLGSTLVPFRKFNAKRKWKTVVTSVQAAMAFQSLLFNN